MTSHPSSLVTLKEGEYWTGFVRPPAIPGTEYLSDWGFTVKDCNELMGIEVGYEYTTDKGVAGNFRFYNRKTSQTLFNAQSGSVHNFVDVYRWWLIIQALRIPEDM